MISTKMSDALTTRPAVTVILMLTALGSVTTVVSKAKDLDGKWMAPLQQYGWDTSELKNKIQHGDVTTFELGTPNYQILNPEDEPEFITEDQPHYREMLRRLTSDVNATDTIDLVMPSASSSASVSATAVEDSPPRPIWEKLRKRSNSEAEKTEEPEMEVETAPLDKRSIHPKVQVYAGARPFQKRVANLS
ncbi:uncharacterized protein LOC117782057 [Drosophila innubila]|uniref:uncharacterized protein LOC117782057 n=1 Tax=Drosophila innubila TaxID=198719 RepID=UPI00148D822F|nr:uncharacterized protein LOC117782057 [Drosophila innubila]